MEAIVMKICATIFWLFLISVFGFAIYGNKKCWRYANKGYRWEIVMSDVLFIIVIIESLLTVIGYYF